MIGFHEFRENWVHLCPSGVEIELYRRRVWVGKDLYVVRLARFRNGSWRAFVSREKAVDRVGPFHAVLPIEPTRKYAQRSAWGFLKKFEVAVGVDTFLDGLRSYPKVR